jgi:glycosyltransferase involved in cell wall biosynthesis
VESASSKPTVAVAIPAYNEADGIAGFLKEIDTALAAQVAKLRLVVVDDASSDGSREVLESLRGELSAELDVLVNPVNRGHGPSVLRAYREALSGDPDYVLQVDGDGQFDGADLRRALVLLRDEAHAVCGVRRFRQDPWFRMVMTRLVRAYVNVGFAVGARDPNCPLRGYEAPLLAELLGALPEECLVPNLYLTVIASRWGLALIEVDVSHRVRRGDSAEGTTWSGGRGRRLRSPVPWRLVRFSVQALRESVALRASLRSAGRARAAPPTPSRPR